MTIYFIGGDFDAVKIGYTNKDTANDRLSSLQTGNPYPLRILAQCPGTQSDESFLHEQFSHVRMCGEWFKRNPTIDDAIQYVTNNGVLPSRAERTWDTTPRVRARKIDPPKLEWQSVLQIWDRYRITSDDKHIVCRFADRWDHGSWFAPKSGSFVEHNSGLELTARAILEADGDSSRECAIWIQATARPYSAPNSGHWKVLVDRVPCWNRLIELAEPVAPIAWHHRSSQVLPVWQSMPDGELALDDFLRYVSNCRNLVWSNYDLIEVRSSNVRSVA